MKKTGRMLYIPKFTLEELEGVKQHTGINKNATALKEFAKYSKIGREVERVNNNLFSALSFGVYPKSTKKFNKKGSSRDVLFAAIVLFVLALGMFAMNFGINQMMTGLITNPNINQSGNATGALQKTQDAVNKMDYIITGVFIALVLGVFITGWFIGGQPIFMIIYFVVVFMAVFLSGFFSYLWKTITGASVWGTTLSLFPMTNHILSNLQIYIAVVGTIGMIVMFAKPYLSPEGGQQI